MTIDINEHATLTSTLVRLSTRIGLDRNARDVTPSLAEYLNTKTRSKKAAAEINIDDEPSAPAVSGEGQN